MKAIILTEYGSPETLQLQEVEPPAPQAGEVLIRVHAAAVNDWDWCLVRGSPFYMRLLCGLRRPNVPIPGMEVAGRVERVGPGISRFQPGDAVYGDLSASGFGGFAEYVCAEESALTAKPEGISFLEAAALAHAGMLAMQGLREAGELQPGQTVLINGAGGGVGTLAVQIARALGAASVTGVDSASKLEMMRAIGFAHAVDYAQTDFTQSPQRYDLILDTKTHRSVFRYLRALNPGGTYVTVGGTTPHLLQVLLLGPLIRWVSGKKVRLVSLKPNQDLDALHALIAAGQLKPVLDGPYSLQEVPQALRYFGEGRHQGKVAITF